MGVGRGSEDFSILFNSDLGGGIPIVRLTSSAGVPSIVLGKASNFNGFTHFPVSSGVLDGRVVLLNKVNANGAGTFFRVIGRLNNGLASRSMVVVFSAGNSFCRRFCAPNSVIVDGSSATAKDNRLSC